MVELNRNDEAIADFQRALALRPDYSEARFADCMAELPIVYETAEEIPRRRAAYERKLRALSDDVAAGKLAGDLCAAITPRQPFLLAYQAGTTANCKASMAAWSRASSRKSSRP